ncbi:MAG: DUF4835 family protein [Saprospiraceae bacterium]
MKKIVLIISLLWAAQWIQAQELNATVKVNTQKVLTADPKIFGTLEQTIREFMNNQKWTDDIFEQDERIKCNLLLTITDQSPTDPNYFVAELAIQASRPIYGSNYETVTFNLIDRNINFSYEQYQPVQYSRNSYNDNLSSILSFYAYIIIGMDYDSFSPLGGEKYFQLAQEVINTLPQSLLKADQGWNSLSNNRNRFWIAENLLSPRVKPFRQAMYEYHRTGLDVMSIDMAKGRLAMADALQKVADVNQAYPNSAIMQLFNSTKSAELIEIFKRGSMQEQDKVIQVMSRVDPANASKYRAIK